MASTVEFTSFPRSVEADTSGTFEFEVEIGDETGQNADVDLTAALYVNGTNEASIVATTGTTATENDIVQGSLSHVFKTNSSINEKLDRVERLEGTSFEPETSFSTSDPDTQSTNRFNSYPRTDEPVFIQVEVDYIGHGTDPDETISTQQISVEVTEPEGPPPQFRSFEDSGGQAGDDTLGSTFQNRTPFAIKQVEFEDDATYVNSVFRETERTNNTYQISFEYPNPTVSIDTAGRFAKHEIIGGSTVRQKIGEDPVNISISGVCKRRTANQIDALRDAKDGQIQSDRLPGSNDSLRVQFGSTSTEPMTDGGSADLKDGRYLYSFQINAIEVIR